GCSLRGSGLALVPLFHRDAGRLDQLLGPSQLAPGQLSPGAGPGQIGLGTGQGGAIRPLIDDEQDGAFLDFLAFQVVDALDIAIDPWPYLYRLHGFDATGKAVPETDFPHHDFGDADYRRWWLLGEFCPALAAWQDGQGKQRGRGPGQNVEPRMHRHSPD